MAVVKLHQTSQSSKLRTFTLAGTVLAVTLAGCKAPANDASRTTKIQSTLSADSAIAGQPVQVSVQGGVVTLNGSVANDAQRALAARDASGVEGIKEVVNNITVGPSTAGMQPTPMLGTPAPAAPGTPAPAAPVASVDVKKAPATKPTPQINTAPPQHQAAPIERPQQTFNEPQLQPKPAQAPAAPPQPTFKTVTVAAGSTIPVRVTQTLDSATTQPDTTFSGVVASDIVVDGVVAIPAGSNITGHVDAVQEAAHFKGSSMLTVSLTSINRRGEHLGVESEPYSVKGKGRGANTAEKAGGGAAVGAIIGGIFGGGKGAAIGAATGGGLGAGSQAITRGQQVQIESESVVRFHLTTPITVKVRTDGADARQDQQGLQPR